MEPLRNDADRAKSKYQEMKPAQAPLYSPQTPHGLALNQTRVPTVGGRGLKV